MKPARLVLATALLTVILISCAVLSGCSETQLAAYQRSVASREAETSLTTDSAGDTTARIGYKVTYENGAIVHRPLSSK